MLLNNPVKSKGMPGWQCHGQGYGDARHTFGIDSQTSPETSAFFGESVEFEILIFASGTPMRCPIQKSSV